jgi:hypothetical protein
MLLDPTKTVQQRNYGQQEIQYSRLTINFNDPGITAGVAFAALPQYAFITSISSFVETAFNAGTTNPVSLGTTVAANELTTTPIPGQTAGYGLLAPVATTFGCGLTSAGPVTLFVKYAPTGGAATAGKMHIVMAYVLNNDL